MKKINGLRLANKILAELNDKIKTFQLRNRLSK